MSQSSIKVYPYKGQVYEDLKRQYSAKNLFVDPEFPANSNSLYYTKSSRGIYWKRPHEICANPQFLVGGFSRFDLDQGQLGNCWFIAAVSVITQRPTIIEHVVPQDQTLQLNRGYNGLFHFRFWQYGKWVDVVIDDQLPVFSDGRLVFSSNKEEKNEFWASLLEKAYAKLSLSYEGLEDGQTTDALIDMTGGIEETYDLKAITDRDGFYSVLINSLAHDALMSSSIIGDTNVKELRLNNGLIRGHAYAITAVVGLNINGQSWRLVRCRNPWGNDAEWNGRFCDRDPVWYQIPPIDRDKLGMVDKADGEFWMSYEDWFNNFDQIQICNPAPETVKSGPKYIKWNCIQFDGEFIPNQNAGGCGQPNERTFWLNPQYLVKIDQNELAANDCVLIVAFMQKYTRQKRREQGGRQAEESLQIRVYRVNENVTFNIYQNGSGDKLYPRDLQRVGTSGVYINKREVSYHCRVIPGYYLIVPSTYDANRELKYLLRIYTESKYAECTSMTVDRPKLYDDDFYFYDERGNEPTNYGNIKWWKYVPNDETDGNGDNGYEEYEMVPACCFLRKIKPHRKTYE